ncbi:MAG: YihA family ribosome biogenesis GTP-binding protein [Oligoflexia bacterium]|nr:YihA family ribosome biogenesis GTP-binding protein [Oligoflexia bacterium]
MKNKRIISIAYNSNQFPDVKGHEIAVAGRSNCGKSTFINTLFREKIAHTSSKPGKTVSINFYRYNTDITIVDLPGYGYARTSQKTRNSWKYLIEKYLSDRNELKLVMLLVDIRREIEDDEISFLNWLSDRNIPYVLVITKNDKLTGNQLKKRKIQILARTENLWQHSNNNNVFFISSLKKTGFEPIKEMIEEFCKKQ